VQPLGKIVWKFLTKLKMEVQDNTAIPPVGIYSEECKSAYSRDNYTPMFIAALVTVANPWNQSICLPIDEWIKRMWHIYKMEYYSVIKKNEIMSFTGK
jgi:hypothetical protein